MSASLEAAGSHVGFQYCVRIIPLGHRCGYVCIPKEHPWYSRQHDYIDVRIHGGLTFSGYVTSKDLDRRAWPCEGYWVGFDCAHCFDLPDFDEMDGKHLRAYQKAKKIGLTWAKAWLEALGIDELEDWQRIPLPEPEMRRRVYVEGQCKQLAAEAFDATKEAAE